MQSTGYSILCHCSNLTMRKFRLSTYFARRCIDVFQNYFRGCQNEETLLENAAGADGVMVKGPASCVTQDGILPPLLPAV